MSNGYFRENEWWVSPYNLIPEVQSKFELPGQRNGREALSTEPLRGEALTWL
jgi:hypothetical protein